METQKIVPMQILTKIWKGINLDYFIIFEIEQSPIYFFARIMSIIEENTTTILSKKIQNTQISRIITVIFVLNFPQLLSKK